MLRPSIPHNEAARVSALHAYNILDTLQEDIFDAITKAASKACGTSMALLTFIDSNRQWFKSRVGLEERETSREISFCAHTINGTRMFVVENASEDPRFQDNPLVAGGPGFRFYAGMPLIASGGLAVGTLCVLDTVPKSLTQEQEATLGRLTDSVMRILNLRRDPATAVFARAVDSTGDGITVSVTAEGNDRIVYANESFLELTGCDYHEVIDQPCTFPATEQCPGSWKALQTALCERRPTTAECRLRSRDGRSIWDRISIVPYLDDQGNVLYTVAIHRDITSEKEAEMQTQQLHAMRTTIATVNHVVNNFLNAAQLYSAHVASGAPVDLGMRLAFEAALQNTRRQITDLNRVTKFRDRATPFGVSLLDLSEDPTERGKE